MVTLAQHNPDCIEVQAKYKNVSLLVQYYPQKMRYFRIGTVLSNLTTAAEGGKPEQFAANLVHCARRLRIAMYPLCYWNEYDYLIAVFGMEKWIEDACINVPYTRSERRALKI